MTSNFGMVFRAKDMRHTAFFKSERKILNVGTFELPNYKFEHKLARVVLKFEWGSVVSYIEDGELIFEGECTLNYWADYAKFELYLQEVGFTLPVKRVEEICEYTIRRLAGELDLAAERPRTWWFFVELKGKIWGDFRESEVIIAKPKPLREIIDIDNVLTADMASKITAEIWRHYGYAENSYLIFQLVRWIIDLLEYGFAFLKRKLPREITFRLDWNNIFR